MERWTIKQLKETDDIAFAISTLRSQLYKLSNPYSPLALKLQSTIGKLEQISTNSCQEPQIHETGVSRIREILNAPESVVVFDIDGVLSAFEYGARNHNVCMDGADWDAWIASHDVYGAARPLRTIRKWATEHEKPERLFVCSIATSKAEREQKRKFIMDNYPMIPQCNVIFADNIPGKLDVLKQIWEMFPDIKEESVVMVEDTTEILTYIQDHSGFSTMHVTSFIP